MAKTYIGTDLIKKIYIGSEKVKKVFIGTEQVYSASHIVYFHMDINDVREIEVEDDTDALLSAPTTDAPSGWDVLGWREDTTASSTVLGTRVVTTDDVHLYAVLNRTLTLSYNGNGATSGSTAAQTGTQYYNNGNQTSLTFKLRSNGYGRTDYTFNYWNTGSTSGTARNAGTNITIADDTVMYAHWTYSASRSGSIASQAVTREYTSF